MPGPNAGKAAAQATRRSRANAYRNRLVAGVTGGFIGGAFTALVRGTGARSGRGRGSKECLRTRVLRIVGP